jgi:Protein of unknown function (DUF1569)
VKTLAREDCTSEVLRRLKTLRADSARRWGRMSAHQMVCHLTDACRMALGEKAVLPVGGLPHRTLVKWIALYTPLRWRAGIQTTPEIDQECDGTKPADFAGDVAELERLITRIAARPPHADWPAHPVFGRISHRTWLRWAYLHLDHHLRQFGI